MIDEKYIDLVTGYLQDTLSTAERRKLNDLIDEGKIDRYNLRELEMFYRQLGSLERPEPESSLRDRFYAMLDTEKEKQEQEVRWRQRFSAWIGHLKNRLEFHQIGYAAAIFLAGLLLGDLFTPLNINNRNEQIDRLTNEVYQMREMMMISLLDNSSPTERLKAVNISNEIRSVDDRIISALLKTLNNDSNVNVRVAAVEALLSHASNPSVRTGLINSIANQESPIVQTALADAMLVLQESQSVDEFKKLLEKNGIDENVRNKLENTITALS